MNSSGQAIPFIYWRRVMFGNTDPAGIVYTPRFTDFCMEAVEVWLDEHIGVNWPDMNINEGRGTPVVNMEITFLSSVRANDRLGVEVKVEKIGRSTVTVALVGRTQSPGQELLVEAFKAKFVFCFTGENKKSMTIPEENRRRLDAYLAMTT